MIFIALLTASLLAGTVGMALSGDSIEDEPEGNEPEDMYANTSNEDDDYRGSFDEDEADGQSGDDLLSSYYSSDDLQGGEGDDKIAGGAQDDLIHGREGNDILSGGTGNDDVYGDEGDDSMLGNFGTDRLFGGDGNDFIAGGEGDDFIIGGGGTDIIRGGEGNDNIFSAGIYREDVESDDVWDTDLQNVIVYDDDDDQGDVINADEGDDTMVVGKNDVIIAGEGNDTVITGTWVNGEVPILTDYEPGNDEILVAVPAGSEGIPITVVDDGDDAVISAGGIDVLRVTGAAGTIDPDDIPKQLTIMTERPVDETEVV